MSTPQLDLYIGIGLGVLGLLGAAAWLIAGYVQDKQRREEVLWQRKGIQMIMRECLRTMSEEDYPFFARKKFNDLLRHYRTL